MGSYLLSSSASQQQQQLPRRPEYIPNRIDDPNYVRIFDTTLRDGEQSPGATMTSAEKLVVARQLARLGVDIIEAGFPASSPDDFDAVRSIAIEVGNTPVGEDAHVPVICGLSRCNKMDIDAVWEAVRHARRPRIQTFIATSEIHMQHKLRKTPEQVVAIAREMVAYARSLGCPDVEFGAEDAGSASEATHKTLKHEEWRTIMLYVLTNLSEVEPYMGNSGVNQGNLPRRKLIPFLDRVQEMDCPSSFLGLNKRAKTMQL